MDSSGDFRELSEKEESFLSAWKQDVDPFDALAEFTGKFGKSKIVRLFEVGELHWVKGVLMRVDRIMSGSIHMKPIIRGDAAVLASESCKCPTCGEYQPSKEAP